ncbi:MAG: quinone-dependent dihydroorotate dehydrogenase [Bdellovibrionales bacterium]
MSFFYKVGRSVLFQMDPEVAHNITIRAMKSGIMPCVKIANDDALAQDIFGLRFTNPIGLAAGFDKNAEVIDPVLKTGFGFTEVGTVTPKPQDGNDKPRVFRDIKNEAVINRMGFPNGGMDVFEKNFKAFEKNKHPTGIVGINIGMNKTQTNPAVDYAALIQRFAKDADYLTINISSPNTPGLRDLQSREPLMDLLDAVQKAKKDVNADTPVLVKFAPDLDDAKIEELSQCAIDGNVDGIIVSNTTLDRPDYLQDGFRDEKGGLSGAPLAEKSTHALRQFASHLKGKIPIIGVGGVSDAEDAYAKIKAGASLVQLYTGLIYKGPNIARDINVGLLECLRRDGYTHISEAVGADHG